MERWGGSSCLELPLRSGQLEAQDPSPGVPQGRQQVFTTHLVMPSGSQYLEGFSGQVCLAFRFGE